MLIDWFTVGAQALNFLVLVWLMKRFLYKPILQAIEAREKIIAAELADAAAKKIAAQKEQEQFQSKNKAFDLERSALLTKADDQAKVESQKILDEARKAADIVRTKRMQSLEEEARNLNKSVTLRAREEVFAITRKALLDLASTSLEEQIATVFIRLIKTMDDKEKQSLGEALKKGSAPAIVRSTFAITDDQRAIIQKTLNETFSLALNLRFETTPELICGIELTSSGKKVEWSMSNYLILLDKNIADLLNEPPSAKKPEDLKPETKAVQPVDAKTIPEKKDSEHAA